MKTISGTKNHEFIAQNRSDFMDVISHEIYTSMNGVMGMTELLLGTRLTDRQKAYARTVMDSADTLLTIINDILDFSKIEAGKLALDSESFDLQDVIEKTAEQMAAKSQKENMELIVRYVPETPQYFIGDLHRIRQIFVNLLSNAVKFTENGYILVTVEEEEEEEGKGERALSSGQRKIKISIKDTGAGVPEDKQQAIFEKFSQIDSSGQRKFSGTGLGLAISKELVAMMGGEIGVTSTAGIGSTFWFTIVLDEDVDLQHLMAPAPSNLEGLRVLVVDDVPVNGTFLEERLQAFGTRTAVCTDGVEALKIMNEAVKKNDPFHMAILDNRMPGMSGEELGREIKGNKYLQNTALVMLTAYLNRQDIKRFQDAGFSAFLTKPVRVLDLAETLSLAWQEFSTGRTGQIITSAAHQKELENIESVQFKNALILLAEDNRTNQGLAVEILEGANCTVDLAEDGKQVLAQIRQKPYDLIFMDCEMPEMDGYETSRILNEMKKDKILGDIPIIALTASVLEGDRERCLNAGMDDYIGKPMQKKDMLTMLKKYLSAKVDEAASDIGDVRFDGYCALLVEDNRVGRMMAEEMLHEIGFDVGIAENGKIAVEEVEKDQYDLILMDVQMPVMDGYESTQNIRNLVADGSIEDVPIIALTANTMKGDRERCLETGMNDYITKPLRKTELKTVIAKWLQPRTKKDNQDGRNRLAENNEHPVLDDDILANYRAVMNKKFVKGVEGFLQDAEALVCHIRKAWIQDDIKTVKISAHSLKSSGAMLGAMELSRLSELMEENAHNLMENGASLKSIGDESVTEMDKALKRAIPFFRRHLDQSENINQRKEAV